MSTAESIAPRPDDTAVLPEHVDVLIVGAGISGIGAGCHLKRDLPGKSFAILEGREAIGGTWDLFRYPGIRSDSDLHTFAFSFKPWTSDNAIADADEIVDYLREAVDEYDLERHIHFRHKVVAAQWSSAEARWTVKVERADTGATTEMSCNVLFSAAGYYDYEQGFRPTFEGEDDFAGTIVHPQEWPEDLSYFGKRVVVIGSGATAITLIPAMAPEAAHVTMLQRSPGYVVSLPAKDPVANTLRRILPERTAYRLVRGMNIARQKLVWDLSKARPGLVRRLIRAYNKAQLPRGYDIDKHFNPQYDPWDQRLCLARSGDLFKAIRSGKASVVTDQIDRFTERGILLTSGEELEADIVVTATGLNLLAFGGIDLQVDGRPVEISDELAYKGMMLSGIPNFAFAVGYTNASWTLKVDLVCKHLNRMLAHMDEHGYDTMVPVADDPTLERRPLLDFSAGYVQRSIDQFPKQGSHGPWTVEMSYRSDRERLLRGPVADPALRFASAAA